MTTIEEQILSDIEAQQETGEEARAYAVKQIPKHVGFWDGWNERGKAIRSALSGEGDSRISSMVPDAMRRQMDEIRAENERLKEQVDSLKLEAREARAEALYQKARRLLDAGGVIAVSVSAEGKTKRDMTRAPESLSVPGYLYERLDAEGLLSSGMVRRANKNRKSIGRQPLKDQIIDLLASAGGPVKAADMSEEIGFAYNSLTTALAGMARQGVIRRVKRGYYTLDAMEAAA